MKRWLPQPPVGHEWEQTRKVSEPTEVNAVASVPKPPLRKWLVNTLGGEQTVTAHGMDIGPGGTLVFHRDYGIDLAFAAHRWIDVCLTED